MRSPRPAPSPNRPHRSQEHIVTSASSHARIERRLLGIALRLGAVLCFAIMAGMLKLAADRGVSLIELIFYRNLFAFPLILTWLWLDRGFGAVRTKRPRAHLTRAGIGLVSMGLNFQALIMLPLAEATTIGFAAPLFATMLSAILLGERVGYHRWIAVVTGFAGVIIVMQPGGGDLPAAGVATAVLSALGVALVIITIRQIGATERPVTTVFWFNLAGLTVMALPMPFAAGPIPVDLWAILIGMGIAGGSAQILMTSSLRHAPVAVLAPFDYSQLLWASIIGWMFWAHTLPAATLAGAALIAASGIYTAYREHRLYRREMAVSGAPPAL